MNLFEIILLLIIILGILAIIYATIYNNLVSYKLKIEKAEGIIDESLRQKYDIIAKLNIAIKKVVTKKDYLKEYIDLKDKRITNYDLDRKLTEIYSLINQIKLDYDKLDSNEDFSNYFEDVYEIDEKLEAAKSFYNKYTTLLNTAIKKFPSNVIASFHHIKVKAYFDGKDMFDEEIKDFKL